MKEFFTRLSVQAVADILCESLGANLIDRHEIAAGDAQVTALTFEKFFMRNSSRASLAVTIDNFTGRTRLHAVGAGGGKGMIFGFDWGAAEAFENDVGKALQNDLL